MAAALAFGLGAPASAGDLLEAGGISTYALTSSRVLKCWGDDDFGQCGDGVTGPAHTNAIDVTGLAGGVVSISAGSRHACAVTTGGVLKCFGNDQYGQIGDGTLGGGLPNDSIPTPVSPIGLSSGVASVGVGMNHSCAVTTTGGAKCWGYNQFGQLGGANIGTDNPTPADVQGLTSGVAAIVGGYYHTCALTTTGGVKCWGNDQFGQLGDGTTGEGMSNSRSTPADVTGLTSGVVAIAAGQVHTCALTSTGGVKCWGNDTAGQLGDGATGPNDNPTPAFVSGLSDGVRAISAHDNEYTCALLLDGTVTCWGRDFQGQLGDGLVGNPSDRPTPAAVTGLSNVVAIATGTFHACALDAQGTVKCWGAANEGQIGDGVPAPPNVNLYPTPQQVSGAYYSVTGGSGYTSGVTLPAPPATASEAGTSVAAGAGIVAIGSPGSNVSGTNSGEVLLYSGSSLLPNGQGIGSDVEVKDGFVRKALADFTLATLQLPPPLSIDKVGAGGVVIDRLGNRVVVGAPGYQNNKGAVLVFEKPPGGWSGTITPTQTLVPVGAVAGDKVGAAIAMTNAGTVIAGAPGATVSGQAGAGKAFVLRPVGSALQFDALPLNAPQPQAGAAFGTAVTGQGGELAVGMPGQTVAGKTNAGAVVTFREPQQGQAFSLPQLITALSPGLADKFGSAVSLDDGTLVVGAPGKDQPSAPDAGAALVFDEAPNGGLDEVATLSDPTPDPGAALGTSVEIGDGTIAAGAPLEDIAGNIDQGTVQVYVPPTSETPYIGALIPTASLFDPTGSAGDAYGTAFVIGPELALAGAPFGDSLGTAQNAKSTRVETSTGEALVYVRDRLFRSGMESIRGAAEGCSNPNVDIPDNNEGGVSDQITLAATGNVRDVDVEVNIAHARVADIILELRHTPSNKSVLIYKPDLLGDPCTGQDIEATFSDQADGGFANDTCNPGTPAVDGVRIPADWLLQFQGAARAGPWVLQAYDAAGNITGKLESWCVNAR